MTQQDLVEWFTYRDGNLFWKQKPAVAVRVGDLAGFQNPTEGYWEVRFQGRNHKLHRLIYIYHHGTIPEHVDHIDGDNTNNRISNLREATNGQNQWNRKLNSNSTSGYKGVYQHRGKWVASIRANKKRYFLGAYKYIEDAVSAVKQARLELHGEYARNE
jgi:hypothetical protein